MYEYFKVIHNGTELNEEFVSDLDASDHVRTLGEDAAGMNVFNIVHVERDDNDELIAERVGLGTRWKDGEFFGFE